MTAFYLFKNHPNFDKINFIVCPDMREGLGSTCDIAGPYQDMVKFCERFPKIDLSLVANNDLWFLENIEAAWKSTFKRRVK